MNFLAVPVTIGFAVLSGVAQASADGNLDPTFNSGSTLTLPLSPVSSVNIPTVIGLTPSDNGGYIVATTYYDGSNTYANDVVRLNVDGSLDTELFGSGKFAFYGPQMVAMTTRRMPVDEMFFVGSFSEGDLTICVYTGTGIKDPKVPTDNNCIQFNAGRFGVAGIYPKAIAVQPWDGKIVIAGSVEFENSSEELEVDMFAVRLLVDGEVDTAFGSNGMTHFNFDSHAATIDAQANAIAFQTDHRIVLAGYTITTSDGLDFAAARLDADGTLQGHEPGNFPIAIERNYDFHGGRNFNDKVTDVQVDTAGHIYLVGEAESAYNMQYNSPTYSEGIVRLNADFTLDTSFLFGSPSVQQYMENGSAPDGSESDIAPGFALDSKSRLIIVSGDAQVDAWRVLPYGGSDPSYNNGSLAPTGRVAVTKPPTFNTPGEPPLTRPRVIVDSHDRPVIAGVTEPFGHATGYQLSIARLVGDDRIFTNGFDLAPQ